MQEPGCKSWNRSHGKTLFNRLASHGLLNFLSYTTQDHLTRAGTNSELGLPTSNNNQENASEAYPQANLTGTFFFSIEVLPSQIIPACVKSIKRTNQDMRTILTKYHILKEWTSTHSLTFWRPGSSRSRVSFILRLLSSACKVYILSLYLHMALPPKFLFQDHYLIKI